MKKDDSLTTDNTIHEHTEPEPAQGQSNRSSEHGQDAPGSTQQIMVRLESGYVLLSPEQFAALCITS